MTSLRHGKSKSLTQRAQRKEEATEKNSRREGFGFPHAFLRVLCVKSFELAFVFVLPAIQADYLLVLLRRR